VKTPSITFTVTIGILVLPSSSTPVRQTIPPGRVKRRVTDKSLFSGQAQPEGDLVRRGEVDSRHRGQGGYQVCRPGGVIEHDVSAGYACCESGDAADGRRPQVKPGKISCRQDFGGRKQVGQLVAQARYARPEPPHDPAQLPSRLAEVAAFPADDGLHGCFERAPGAWCPDGRAGACADHPARSFRQVYQAFPVRQVCPEQQVIGSSRVNFQHAGGAIETDRPAVYGAGH
jgi:hypothetical protein